VKGCRPLSDAEVDLLQRSFGGTYGARDRALFLLGVKSGFRISELLSLRLRDVCQHGRVVDRVTVARRYMKKQLEGRTVPLHAEAQAAFAAWLRVLQQSANTTPQTYVFRSRKGVNQPISKFQAWKILREAVTTNELTGKLGTHCMRKTFADRVYQRLNYDLVKTQRALGHKNINSTVSYLSFAEAEIEAAILGCGSRKLITIEIMSFPNHSLTRLFAHNDDANHRPW
jgi:integrase